MTAGGQSDTHGALQPFYEAARLATANIVLLPVPMRWRPPRFISGNVALALRAVTYLVAHLRLARDLWQRREHDLIIVREFLTVFLILVWPFIWPLRRRVCFLVNHNLQEAHRRSVERRILRLLHRTGIRLGCFETASGFEEVGIRPSPETLLVLPHPIMTVVPPRPARLASELPVIGVIGAVRAEKGVNEILAALLTLRQRGRLPWQLVFGCPDSQVRAQWSEGFEVIDTGTAEGYVTALDRCDVVILNYQRDRYYYRPSGVAADAIARRVVVVCPDFPLMNHQLTRPARVGALFDGINDLERAIGEAMTLAAPGEPDSWRAHEIARGPAAIATMLDRFVQNQRR